MKLITVDEVMKAVVRQIRQKT